MVIGTLASLEGGAFLALLRFEQGGFGHLLPCNDLVQLGEVWPLRLWCQKLSSWRLLVCLPCERCQALAMRSRALWADRGACARLRSNPSLILAPSEFSTGTLANSCLVAMGMGAGSVEPGKWESPPGRISTSIHLALLADSGPTHP